MHLDMYLDKILQIVGVVTCAAGATKAVFWFADRQVNKHIARAARSVQATSPVISARDAEELRWLRALYALDHISDTELAEILLRDVVVTVNPPRVNVIMRRPDGLQ